MRRALLTKGLPDLLALDKMVGLLPKMVFGEGTIIPTIRNNAMLAWRYASEVCGLLCR